MPERRTIAVAGKQVRLLIGGDGPPLVYLHSAGADVEWGEAHELLAAKHTVYAPAAPGFAESTGIEDVDGIQDLVLHTVDLLDMLDLRSVPLVGTSFGGWIAAEVAALYPDRVSQLVLVDPVGLWLDAHPIGELFGTPPPDLAKLLFHDLTNPIAAMMLAFTPEMVPHLPEEIVLPQLKAMEALAKVGWNPYLHDPKLEGRLRRVTAKTLILWGANDGIVDKAYAKHWQSKIKNSTTKILESCGHLPPVERPQDFAAATLTFLSK
ncbi:MAG TPA: alpha/beta hydrolase [Candidatus Binatia bacterium]|jgi:pimeloyl-ACP methyl ester carboxylesterase|nr:alpha/beta hydrolase [Candidatus Binatia bacterium]